MQFLNGMTVELVTDMDVFNLGRFPSGARGKVIHVQKITTPGMPIAVIRMDDHFDCLNDWDNELQVFRDEDGEITANAFRAA